MSPLPSKLRSEVSSKSTKPRLIEGVTGEAESNVSSVTKRERGIEDGTSIAEGSCDSGRGSAADAEPVADMSEADGRTDVFSAANRGRRSDTSASDVNECSCRSGEAYRLFDARSEGQRETDPSVLATLPMLLPRPRFHVLLSSEERSSQLPPLLLATELRIGSTTWSHPGDGGKGRVADGSGRWRSEFCRDGGLGGGESAPPESSEVLPVPKKDSVLLRAVALRPVSGVATPFEMALVEVDGKAPNSFAPGVRVPSSTPPRCVPFVPMLPPQPSSQLVPVPAVSERFLRGWFGKKPHSWPSRGDGSGDGSAVMLWSPYAASLWYVSDEAAEPHEAMRRDELPGVEGRDSACGASDRRRADFGCVRTDDICLFFDVFARSGGKK